VCLSVSVRGRMPTLLHGAGYNFKNGRGCLLVVRYWADLHSVHGLRCYDNIARTQNVTFCLYSLCAWLCYYPDRSGTVYRVTACCTKNLTHTSEIWLSTAHSSRWSFTREQIIQTPTCDTTVHKGQKDVTMATNFGAKNMESNYKF